MNLLALKRARKRKKNKYELMLDDLDRIEQKATLTNILNGFPIQKS